MIVTILFLVFAIILILCTIVEIILAGGIGELVMQSSLPWLIAGWCIWLAAFYAVRKWNKDYERFKRY